MGKNNYNNTYSSSENENEETDTCNDQEDEYRECKLTCWDLVVSTSNSWIISVGTPECDSNSPWHS